MNETPKTAPWPDYEGNIIHEGDKIAHPSGETGTVVFLADEFRAADQWRVEYEDGTMSRLCLQVGRGEAVVVDD